MTGSIETGSLSAGRFVLQLTAHLQTLAWIVALSAACSSEGTLPLPQAAGASGAPVPPPTAAAGSGGQGASLPTGGVTGAAGAPSAGARSTDPTDDDAGTLPDAGTGSSTAGSGAAGSLAPPPPPPLTLPEPDQLGPYEVVSEINVGVGYENPINQYDMPNTTYCTQFSLGFGQDEAAARKFAEIPPDLNMALYTMYRPKQFEEGKTYPMLTWGNGTCALPEGYGTLLRHVASHGFVVVAANSRFTAGSGESAPMIRAIEWALEANADPTSALYGRIDPEKIGAFGHSQGAGATWSAAQDARIKTNVVLNGSASGTRESSSLFVSGDRDIVSESAQRSSTNAQAVAAMVFFHMIPGDGSADGHLTLITEPERVVGPTTAWFRYQLSADPVARDWFVGASCKLCGHEDQYEYLANGLQ